MPRGALPESPRFLSWSGCRSPASAATDRIRPDRAPLVAPAMQSGDPPDSHRGHRCPPGSTGEFVTKDVAILQLRSFRCSAPAHHQLPEYSTTPPCALPPLGRRPDGRPPPPCLQYRPSIRPTLPSVGR